MKYNKILLFILVICLIFVFTGCIGESGVQEDKNSNKPSENYSATVTDPSHTDVDQNEGTYPQENKTISENTELFQILSGKIFTLASGAGFWETRIQMNSDGSFSGYYVDYNGGEDGNEYPDGTKYESKFDGKFILNKKIDEFTYSVKLSTIKYEEEKISIVDGMKIVSTKPYGFEDGKDFLFYAKGHPVDTLENGFVDWVSTNGSTLQIWGLYNVKMGYGMYEDLEADSIKEESNDTPPNDNIIKEPSLKQNEEGSSSKNEKTSLSELDLYKEYLNNLISRCKKNSSGVYTLVNNGDVTSYKYFAIADLNSDGTDDMMIYSESEGESGNTYGNKYEFFTINSDRKVVSTNYAIVPYDYDPEFPVFYSNGVVVISETDMYSCVTGTTSAFNTKWKIQTKGNYLEFDRNEDGETFTMNICGAFDAQPVKEITSEELMDIQDDLYNASVLKIAVKKLTEENVSQGN